MEEAYLHSLSVSKTVDEFGTPRYFVTDWNGDWVGDPFDTPEAAFEEIDAKKKELETRESSGSVARDSQDEWDRMQNG